MSYPNPTDPRARHILIERSPTTPPPNALTCTNLVGDRDGTTIRYSQWEKEPPALPQANRFHLYRSVIEPGPPTPTGCVVLARAVFDSPDPERQRAWVDALLKLGETDTTPMPGLLAAHFHLSDDGTEILNYAEWTSRDSHQAIMEAPTPEDDPPTPEWNHLYTWPGLIQAEAQRYHLA